MYANYKHTSIYKAANTHKNLSTMSEPSDMKPNLVVQTCKQLK